MKRFVLLLASLALAACNPSADERAHLPETPQLSYAMTLDRSGEEPSLVVELHFAGDSDGSTWLVLPHEWGGETELNQFLTDIIAISPDTEVLTSDRASVMEINHPPSADVHLRYRLNDGWEAPPTPGDGNPYRPIITEDYAHLIGWTAWALPQWDDWPGENPQVDFTLDWSGLPGDWTIADNFGVGREPRTSRAPLNRLQAGMFVAGDFRLMARETGTAPLNVAIRGSWPFSDTEFANNLAEVIAALRDFWREEGDEPYLVTLIPIMRPEGDEGSISWGGTGLSDAFALFATTNVELENFQTLAAHEFQHRWTPSALGEFADPEEALYWFSEGFTDYYMSLLLLRGGLIDLEAYTDQINNVLREYYRSPARHAPVDQVVEWNWSDRDIQRIPYMRGRFIAARWNAQLMLDSDEEISVDAVLFDLLEAGEAARAAGEPRRLGPGDIITAMEDVGLETAAADHRAFVVEGGMVPIEPGMFGPCLDVRETDLPIFEIGFDVEASFELRTIIGVREGGPAWNANIRDGMLFGGYSIPNIGDPNTDATIFVGIEGEAVPIAYQPQSDETETIPQIYIADNMSEDERTACLAWLGVS